MSSIDQNASEFIAEAQAVERALEGVTEAADRLRAEQAGEALEAVYRREGRVEQVRVGRAAARLGPELQPQAA